MIEYRLDVKDTPDPKSRLVFLKRLETFLALLKHEEIIQSYSLSTPYGSTTIFKVEAEEQ